MISRFDFCGLAFLLHAAERFAAADLEREL
jgi:hypothetical protein